MIYIFESLGVDIGREPGGQMGDHSWETGQKHAIFQSDTSHTARLDTFFSASSALFLVPMYISR